MERREQFAAGDYKSGKYRPLLDSLLQYKDETTGQGLSEEDIRVEVDTFMFEVRCCHLKRYKSLHRIQ